MTDIPKTPHPPLEDWLPALRHTQLNGTLFWVSNEEDVIVDATPDVADAAGVPICSYIGRSVDDLADQVVEPPLFERRRRRQRLFEEGGSHTMRLAGDLPGRGWTIALVTSTRVTHPDTGGHYLVNAAHDVTDLESQLDYLRAPAFQGLFMLIIEADGTVLAATDAAAKFCNPELTFGYELTGATIDQTDFSDMRNREATELARSRKTGEPSVAVEWLMSGDGAVRPYSVSRILFPKGRWMIQMIPFPLTDPFFQVSTDELLEATNMAEPVQLNPVEFQTLVGMRSGLSVKELAERRSISTKAINKRRERLADAIGVVSVKHIMPAVAHTELGTLATIYSQRIVDEPPATDKRPKSPRTGKSKNKRKHQTD